MIWCNIEAGFLCRLKAITTVMIFLFSYNAVHVFTNAYSFCVRAKQIVMISLP